MILKNNKNLLLGTQSSCSERKICKNRRTSIKTIRSIQYHKFRKLRLAKVRKRVGKKIPVVTKKQNILYASCLNGQYNVQFPINKTKPQKKNKNNFEVF